LQTAALIVEQVGVDLNQLDQELAKLASYTAEREIIEAVDVDQSIDSRRSYSTFDLLRQVGRHKPATALKILKRLILVGEAPLAILGSLSWQVRILWQIKDGILRGQSKEDIGRALSLRPHLFHGYWQEAQQATLAGLRRLHDALRQSDLTLKSTGISPELVLELLLLELCCVKRSGHGVEHLAAGRRSRQPS
jgi:DNA polymerase-3 subunit delta